MLFITNPRLRKLEVFMQEVPNFPPKGNKVDLDSLEDEILLFEIENVIINVKPPNENLNTGKDNIMKFRNEKHRSTFLSKVSKTTRLSQHCICLQRTKSCGTPQRDLSEKMILFLRRFTSKTEVKTLMLFTAPQRICTMAVGTLPSMILLTALL